MNREKIRAKILPLLEGTETWPQARKRLKDADLLDLLDTGDMETVVEQWQAGRAAGLPDRTLLKELRYWADGGTFAEHIHGFNALRPGVLTAEARRRDWFVRDLPGKAVINPPDEAPVVVPLERTTPEVS